MFSWRSCLSRQSAATPSTVEACRTITWLVVKWQIRYSMFGTRKFPNFLTVALVALVLEPQVVQSQSVILRGGWFRAWRWRTNPAELFGLRQGPWDITAHVCWMLMQYGCILSKAIEHFAALPSTGFWHPTPKLYSKTMCTSVSLVSLVLSRWSEECVLHRLLFSATQCLGFTSAVL